jgi:hypothetical protein
MYVGVLHGRVACVARETRATLPFMTHSTLTQRAEKGQLVVEAVWSKTIGITIALAVV